MSKQPKSLTIPLSRFQLWRSEQLGADDVIPEPGRRCGNTPLSLSGVRASHGNQGGVSITAFSPLFLVFCLKPRSGLDKDLESLDFPKSC